MVYKIRIIADLTDQDVFRDLYVLQNQSFEELHNAIVNAFGLDGMQMASFYVSNDDWNQGEEIPLFDVSEEGNGKTMTDFEVIEFLDKKGSRMLYNYDFLNLNTFFVETIDVDSIDDSQERFPMLIYSYGEYPTNEETNLDDPTAVVDDPNDDFRMLEKDDLSDWIEDVDLN